MARRKTKRKTPKGHKIKKISRLRKPEDMPLEQWQIALRKQFAQKQNFRLKNIGEEPIFSEFTVTNPETSGEYRVAIRGQRIGDNYCSCPDFAGNTLGTCKHIEFALAKLQRKRGGEKSLCRRVSPWLLRNLSALRRQAGSDVQSRNQMSRISSGTCPTLLR